MRHAIYYTPQPQSDLHKLGSAWLGRDAVSNEAISQPDRSLERLTTAPRRYGLHATLKAPFYMKPNVDAALLDLAARRLSAQHKSFMAPALSLEVLDGFLALVPTETCAALDHLAADCVQKLDDFRIPPSEAELRRRRAAGLTDYQNQLLQRWGYPYVLDEFRFHITLTESLSEAEVALIKPAAERHFAPILGKEFMVDAITLMIEPDDGQDFRLLDRFPLVQHVSKVA